MPFGDLKDNRRVQISNLVFSDLLYVQDDASHLGFVACYVHGIVLVINAFSRQRALNKGIIIGKDRSHGIRKDNVFVGVRTPMQKK